MDMFAVSKSKPAVCCFMVWNDESIEPQTFTLQSEPSSSLPYVQIIPHHLMCLAWVLHDMHKKNYRKQQVGHF